MIEQPYLLAMTIACYQDDQDRRHLDELWHKDFLKHLDHIRDLTLASPLRHDVPPGKMIEIVTSPGQGTVHFVDLPECRSTLGTLAKLHKIIPTLWDCVGRAEIVHGNAGGWPISFGWIVIPMAKLRGKFLLTNVESGLWRLGFRRPWRLKSLLQAVVYELMARLIVNLSDIATFTHAGYRDSMLLPFRRHRGHVIPASWIDRENIIAPAATETLWSDKLADPGRSLRIVYAAHLNTAKGVLVLLDALRELDRRGVELSVDLYGKGEHAPACEEAARTLTGSVKLFVRGMLDYHSGFFEMLQEHDLMIVPSLSDEQPRIIFDAFARSIPVVASDTLGIRELVTDGLNGKVFPAGDPLALADAIEWASKNRESLRQFGIRAVEVASALTHDQMHARRAALIEAAVNQRTKLSFA